MSKSYTKNIQSKPKKKIINNAVIAAKIETMIEHGRIEVTTKKQLEKYPIGSLISYMNKNNEFKQGGFITKFSDEYFIYITPDFKTRYRVRYKNILKMWVGDVYTVTGDIISLAESTNEPTNFKVKIGNIVVYYAKDAFDAKRFSNTKKYKTMKAWFDFFNKK